MGTGVAFAFAAIVVVVAFIVFVVDGSGVSQ